MKDWTQKKNKTKKGFTGGFTRTALPNKQKNHPDNEQIHPKI
jgi:hypothetical protein